MQQRPGENSEPADSLGLSIIYFLGWKNDSDSILFYSDSSYLANWITFYEKSDNFSD